MELQIFSVFDSKAEAFIMPFFSQTIAVACRSFGQACNDEKENFHRYAADYTLFHVGTFEQDTGLITAQKTPINLGLASTFIEAKT